MGLDALAVALVVDVTADNARALALAVLDDECVRLAHEVLDGGPVAMRRAIELAALVRDNARSRPDSRPKNETGATG